MTFVALQWTGIGSTSVQIRFDSPSCCYHEWVDPETDQIIPRCRPIWWAAVLHHHDLIVPQKIYTSGSYKLCRSGDLFLLNTSVSVIEDVSRYVEQWSEDVMHVTRDKRVFTCTKGMVLNLEQESDQVQLQGSQRFTVQEVEQHWNVVDQFCVMPISWIDARFTSALYRSSDSELAVFWPKCTFESFWVMMVMLVVFCFTCSRRLSTLDRSSRVSGSRLPIREVQASTN